MDENVIQHTTSNTSYFSDDRLEGLQLDTISQKYETSCSTVHYQCCCFPERKKPHSEESKFYQDYARYYGFKPIDVKVMRLDWLLENVSDNDKQPRAIKLLSAIL